MSNKKIIIELFKDKSAVVSLLVVVFSSILFLFGTIKYALPSVEKQIMLNIIDEATRVSNHLTAVYDKDKDFSHMLRMKEDLNLDKIRFFDDNGKILYSSDKKEIGNINKKDYYHNIVAKGNVYYKIVAKGKNTLDGIEYDADVAEVYIPIMKNGKFIYAFEVYYDITSKIAVLNQLKYKMEFILVVIVLLVVSIVLIRLISAKKTQLQEQLHKEQLFRSEKMASMGDMIGNIAHQWRQPLSAITSNASALKLNYELGIMSENELKDKMDSIIEKANYLSETINTFRDYIKDDKVYRKLSLQSEITQATKIVKSVLDDHKIELISSIDMDQSFEVEMVSGELQQAIINIINNAKDVLIEKHIQNPWVKVDITKEDSQAIITIEDNAGGVPDSIIPKIFDPYFTTKHKSQGTGLGLHMSYKIVSESLGGKISVENSSNGAQFFIMIPLENE